MPEDIIERVDRYIGDETKMSKLASTIHYRALELALLREILVEMRKLTGALEGFRLTDNDRAPAPKQ